MCQNYYCLDQWICTLMKLLQMNSTWLAMKYEKDCSTIVPKWMMVGWLKDESTNHFLSFCQPSSCHKPAWTFRNQPDLNTNTQTRSIWLNCALRDDEAVYLDSIRHYEALAIGTWWYWVSRGHLCLYILNKVDVCLTDWLTHWQTLKDRASQLLIK